MLVYKTKRGSKQKPLFFLLCQFLQNAWAFPEQYLGDIVRGRDKDFKELMILDRFEEHEYAFLLAEIPKK
jgi:hypothetical protein